MGMELLLLPMQLLLLLWLLRKLPMFVLIQRQLVVLLLNELFMVLELLLVV